MVKIAPVSEKSSDNEREKPGNAGKNRKSIMIGTGVAISIILVIAFVVVGFLTGIFGGKTGPILCETQVCKSAADHIKRNANFSVDPCDDFYNHVCGNYRGDTSIFKEKTKELFKSGIDVLDSKASSKALDKIRKFRMVCRTRPLNFGDVAFGEIANIGFSPVLLINDSFDLTSAVAKYLMVTSDLGIFHLKELPLVDVKNNKVVTKLLIGGSETLMALDNKTIRDFYLEVAKNIYAHKFHVSDVSLLADDDVFDDRISRLLALTENLKDIFKVLQGSQLSLPVKGVIDWNTVASFISPTGTNLYSSIYDPYGLNKYITLLVMIHGKAIVVDLMFLVYVLNNIAMNTDCDEAVHKLFPGALGMYHLYSKIDMKNNNEVIGMANVIRESFIDSVKKTTWMDEESKKKEIEKLERMKYYIGYDEIYEKKEEVEKIYSTLLLNFDDKFYNLLSEVHKWQKKMLYEEVAGITVRNLAGPQLEMNAFYVSTGNLLYFSLGFISFPQFHRDQPIYSNYGGTGFILGHEMGHSCGPVGSQFGIDGMPKLFFSISTMKDLIQKFDCLMDFYTNREQVDGKLTLEENAADVIGIRLAFDAMQKIAGTMERNVVLPGFEDKTNEQMFFLASSANWCEDPDSHIKEDSHAFGKTRVNGPLSLSKDFAKAFSCKEGSKMNPKEKCGYYGD